MRRMCALRILSVLLLLSAPGGEPIDSPAPALAPAATLHGQVVDARGRPLVEVLLSASRFEPPAEDEDPPTARTSADGTFRLPGLRTGAGYLVTASLAGFAPASIAVSTPGPGEPLPALRLVLGRGRTVFGKVVDEKGRPVRGARVELEMGARGRAAASEETPRGDSPWRMQTGEDGKLELRDLPAGWFRLRIEADGFLAFERDGVQILSGAGRTDLGRFALQRGAAFEGWVGDPGGEPVAGAEVWILPEEVRDWSELYAEGPAAVTEADGSFVVRDLPREAGFGLDICRSGYLPLSATVRDVGPEIYRAVLQRAASLSGRVTTGDGTPVPAARIASWLAGEAPTRTGSLRPCRSGAGTASTDADGRFRLDSLPPGWWSLRATAGGYRSVTRERLHVLAGESLDGIGIEVDAGAAVFGRVVTAGGDPAPGARVVVLSREEPVQTVAGGDGTYRLAGVEPGERTIEATLEEGTWASGTLTVVPGENRLDLTIDQGSPRQEIRGRVLGPDGSPAAGATVLATGSGRTFSAADGSFTLRVEDHHEYEIWAEKERFAAARAEAVVRVEGAPVAGVEVRLLRGGSLTGRILGLEPEELTRAGVEVDLSPPFQARAAVDLQGNYRVEDIPPGEWDVTARAGGRSVRARAVLPPGVSEASVDLTFEPSHEVSGRIAGTDGAPVADAYIRFFAPGRATGNTYSRSDGGFRLRLEDGSYRVVARREGYLWTAQEEPVIVEGGPVAGLELHLEEAAVIRGRILGLDPGERARAVWISTGGNSGRRKGQLDQEGGFLIADVPPGDWTVTVAHGSREVGVSLHLEPGENEAWVEVELGGD